MDIESASKRDKVIRAKWAVFTFFGGVGFGLGITCLNSNNNQSALITGIIMGSLIVGAGILILTYRTDDEKEWVNYEHNRLGKSDCSGIKLSLGLGLLNLGAVRTATNVVYTNIQPCVTARVSF
jgi:hypothetical protein